MEKNFAICALFDQYKGLLTPKQQDAVDLYYNQDLSLGEIAENLHITRQGVHDAIRRAQEVLTGAEAQLGFCKKISHYENVLEEVKNLVARGEDKEVILAFLAAQNEDG